MTWCGGKLTHTSAGLAPGQPMAGARPRRALLLPYHLRPHDLLLCSMAGTHSPDPPTLADQHKPAQHCATSKLAQLGLTWSTQHRRRPM
jgi:hypothetical protein